MQKIFAANWKMYKTRAQAAQSSSDLAKGLVHMPAGQDVVVFCALYVHKLRGRTPLKAWRRFRRAGRTLSRQKKGLLLAKLRPPMLLDAWRKWVLTGHSERRHIMGEDDVLVARKTIFALEHGLKVLFCIGETLDEREAGKLNAVLERQLAAGFSAMPEGLRGRCPCGQACHWLRACVGHWHRQGCRPEEVLDAHAVTRALLKKLVGETADKLPILYGGSVKPNKPQGLWPLTMWMAFW